MRAISHALVAILVLTGHVHLAPASAGRQDHRPGLQRGAILQLDLVQPAGGTRRDRPARPLQVHDVDVIVADMLFEMRGELGALGMRDRDEILDRHRVEHLAAKALGGDTGANALARGVDRRRGARGAAADDEHVECVLCLDLLGRARRRGAVDLGDDLLEPHPALAEQFAVQIDGGHRHDLACVDLVLEQSAFDRDMADTRVEHAHQVLRLHHVGAVLAGEREIGFERIVAVERLDLFDHVLRRLRRMVADLEQRDHERGEFMPHRDAGEADADIGADAADHETGGALVIVLANEAHLVRQPGNLLEQFLELDRLGAGVERGDQFDRLGDVAEIGLELLLEIGVQHDPKLHG
jgi:hypothetical protein